MHTKITPFPAPSLLNEHQAAEVLNLTVSSLRNWRLRGDGPTFIKAGRLVRYRPSDLDDWVNRRAFASTSQMGRSA
ncbi:helix-turn-helix transcriptional regulator [Aestuariivirga sp.]|uniref:helix-turn-helix transcriptional regulator n=1 Tax=Aestuariivirga sp. TaxID=2650926 RepID=UPI0039E613DE